MSEGQSELTNRQDLQKEELEVKEISDILKSIEGRVRRAKVAGIQVPADEATKFARIDTKATLEEKKVLKDRFDQLIQTIMVNGEEERIADQGDLKFIYKEGHIEATALIPDPNDKTHDAPSEKVSFRIDTDGRQDLIVNFDSKDRGVVGLGIIFATPEEEEISNIAPFNTGIVPLTDIRSDEAKIIGFFTSEAQRMVSSPSKSE